MPTDVLMPQMGESIFEGTITKWLKKTGEQVQRDEPLFEISTDKVDAEIPSPTSGLLKEIRAKEGETVQVNTVVAVIDEAGSAAATPSQPASATPAPTPAASAASAVPTAASTDGPAQPAAASAGAGASGDGGGAAIEVPMPQMGESIFEGTITKWLKKVGEKVQRDEPLFEISTDKVDAEIPAPASGVLREIRAQEGQTVQVNSIVAVLGGEGAAGAAAPAAQPSVPAAAVGQPEIPKAAASASGTTAQEEETEEVIEGKRIRSSPLVRKMAKDHGINLAQLSGTGLGGRITKDDITKFIETGKKAPAPAAPPAAPVAAPPAQAAARAAAPMQPFQPAEITIPGELEPMSKMRKIIAERMVESKRTSAHVHSAFQVDMTRAMVYRERMKKKFEQATGTKLTVMPFFCRAAVNALAKFPIINASVEGDNIRYHREINIGIAVALDWGLIVPVVKHAEERNFLGLQRTITDLADRARAKKLKPEEVQGGTFTITNPGNYGQMFGLPIISQPQLAILGVGNIRKTPWVVTDAEGNDSIAIRQICHITLGYDHRVIDGAVADQFLREVNNYLVNWNEEIL